MLPTDLIYAIIRRVILRVMRRTVGWMLVLVGLVSALWEATAAAVVALEYVMAPVYAHLVIAGFYALVAVLVLTILALTARRVSLAQNYRASVLSLPPELQIAAIIEALVLGYTLARRK
jgi:hypothetical protein